MGVDEMGVNPLTTAESYQQRVTINCGGEELKRSLDRMKTRHALTNPPPPKI